MTVKSLDELLKVPSGIVGARGGLRMVLHCEHWELAVPESFYRAIIEVKVGDFKFFSTRDLVSRSLYGKSMILAGDQDTPRY